MPDERYDLKNINDAFSIIEKEGLKEVYQKYVSDFGDRKFGGIYTSKKEIINSIKERVLDGLEDRYKDLKLDISHLRKKGFDVNMLDFNLLRFPLKKKMLSSDFCIENYRVILDLFNMVAPSVKSLIKEMEEKEKLPKKTKTDKNSSLKINK